MEAQTDMTWEKATNIVINMDLIDANQKISSNASKDQVHYIGGSRWCKSCKKTNHWTKDCFQGKGRQRNPRAFKANQPNAGQPKSKIKFYNCGKSGKCLPFSTQIRIPSETRMPIIQTTFCPARKTWLLEPLPLALESTQKVEWPMLDQYWKMWWYMTTLSFKPRVSPFRG